MQKKIYFIHNSYTWYREPLFIKLSEICNIKFFFTKLWKNGYEEISHDCYSINKNLDHEVVKNRFHIAWPVFGHLIKDDYDSVLVTAMDNWHQTFEAFVSAAIARLRGKRAAYFWEKWDKGWLECEKRNWKTHEISFLRYLWRIRRFYVKRIELRLLSHLADSFVPVGSYSKEYFINCGVKEEKIYIAPEASEIFYDRIKTREEMGMSKDRLIILFMARLIKLKGIDQLLEAYSKLEKEVGNVELYVGGTARICKKQKKGRRSFISNALFGQEAFNLKNDRIITQIAISLYCPITIRISGLLPLMRQCSSESRSLSLI